MVFWIVIILGVLVLFVIAGIVQSRKRQRKSLDTIREQWGKPKNSRRNFQAISSYLDLTATEQTTSSADLDKDDIFNFIDRTNSNPANSYCISFYIQKILLRTTSSH